MTEAQIKYLLTFFRADDKPNVSINDISKRLITEGTCIVGGIIDFIKIDYVVGNFDCFSYTFDLNVFLGSDYFIQERNRKLKSLEEEMGKILEQFNEIQSL